MNTNTMGIYGNYYLKRAVVAMVGLGADQPEDAVYPMCVADAEGKPLSAENDYVLHFNKEQLPPVSAFWSLTIYDSDGYQLANSLDRFALGDRDALNFNADGSLDIFIQRDSPGKEKQANWLPTAQGGVISPTMRLYAPKAQVLDGSWNPPPLRAVNQITKV